MVAAAVKGVDMMIYENRCQVQGREQQHDCMFFKWSCRGVRRAETPAWPCARQVRPRLEAQNTCALLQPARDTIEAPTLEADDISSRGSEHADEAGASEHVDWGPSEHADEDSAPGHPDEDNASNHAGDGGDAQHFDELAAIGFAFARSASLLQSFQHSPHFEIASTPRG